ncbi:MAG: helix-turn-helix domain-containing protein [Ramlibacter sp.]|nr:helix-turn-helix domain-containing protein [Ramlibacter sp.]
MAAISASVPPPALRRWSTDEVDPAQRLDYWVGAICEAFLEMDCSSREAASFDGALTSLALEAISFNRVVASTQDVYRTPGAIARGRQHPFYLITQLQTAWHVRQGGHLAQLRPGDAVAVDAAQAYELHFPESVACLSVQMPRAWVGQWLTRLDQPAPRLVPRDRGWGQALSALCLQLGNDPGLAAGYPPTLLADQMGAMLASVLETADAPTPARSDLAGRALRLIQLRFGEPGLTAQDVACALGVSVRTLHRAFAACQSTFAGSLRTRRLTEAARLLAQPRLAGLAVAEIGRRCGFADPSHFVREFQRAHGQSPGRWRRARVAG